jgi:hypothetical protein
VVGHPRPSLRVNNVARPGEFNHDSDERLVAVCNIDGDDATRAIGWLMGQVIQSIEQDQRAVSEK